MFKQKKKSAVTRITTDIGGELGIRTLGWLITNTKFRVLAKLQNLQDFTRNYRKIKKTRKPDEMGVYETSKSRKCPFFAVSKSIAVTPISNKNLIKSIRNHIRCTPLFDPGGAVGSALKNSSDR